MSAAPGGLDPAEGRALRAEIARQRQRVTARLAALERDLDDIVSASAESVRDDEHDPEGATIAFERAQVSALLADARGQLAALDRAAGRLARGEAARCATCGGAIAAERLLARPTATTCLACAARSRRPRGAAGGPHS